MNDVYLVIGNHYSLVGVWEQVTITLRTFQHLNIDLKISTNVVENAINIIIEEFSNDIVDQLIKIKAKSPDTKYILYVSEYIDKYGNLNTFNSKELILRKLTINSPDSLYTNYYDGPIPLLDKTIKNVYEKICNVFRINYAQEIMLARRQNALKKLMEANIIEFIVSTTKRVLLNYDELFKCETFYVPIFVNPKLLKERLKIGYTPGVIFTGNLTNHRSNVIKKLRNSLHKSYPLTMISLHKNSREKRDYLNKLKKLDKIGIKHNILNLDSDFELIRIENSLYNLKLSDVPIYELYIPQSKNWNLSSPNRTLFSLESGYIPVNIGLFDDHDIAKIALAIEDPMDLNNLILEQNEYKILEKIVGKVDEYNEKQKDYLSAVNKRIAIL